MSDYDVDDYESFDLGRAGGSGTPSRREADAAAEDSDFDEDDDELDDEPEDAEDDEIDLVLAVYREDGVAVARALPKELANDLEELIVQLRRLPGDAGAIGFVSLVGEVFVIVRVRGRMVQTLVSDAASATEWPIARDIADYLGESDIDEDEAEPLGDLGLLADVGISELDLEGFVAELDDDADSDEVVLDIADKLGVGREVRRVVDAEFA